MDQTKPEDDRSRKLRVINYSGRGPGPSLADPAVPEDLPAEERAPAMPRGKFRFRPSDPGKASKPATRPPTTLGGLCPPGQQGFHMRFVPTTEPFPDEDTSVAAIFHRTGDIWTLAFNNHSVHIRHLKGMDYIAELLRRPHVPIEAAQLAGVDVKSTGLASSPGLELADEKAIKAVRDELAEKKTELAGLQERDWTRKGALQEEISKLEKYLGEVENHQGQARKVAGTAQRARPAVTNAINRAIKKISKSHPDLGLHLNESLMRGTVLTYKPADLPDWSF